MRVWIMGAVVRLFGAIWIKFRRFNYFHAPVHPYDSAEREQDSEWVGFQGYDRPAEEFSGF